MTDSKNFSEPILRVGDGVQAEESGIASNQPGMADPSITYKPANKRWEYTNDGVLSHVVGALPQFPTQAAAIAAGLNKNGLMYFNTTVNNKQVWIDDPAGDGSVAARFMPISLVDSHLVAICTTGQVVPTAGGVNIIHNIIANDNLGQYNAATGGYGITSTGLYVVINHVSLVQPSGGISQVVEASVAVSGANNYTMLGTQYNGTNFVTSAGTAICAFTRRIAAGSTIFGRIFQDNSSGISLPLRSVSFRNHLTIAKVAE